MDACFEIPGTRIRFGLDSILGLIPGLGDSLTALLSLYLVARALSVGAPASVIGRMVMNVLIDAVVGAVPLFGDVADVFWRANMRNARLLEAYEGAPGRTVRRSRVWIVLILLAVFVVFVSVLYAAARLLIYLWSLLT